MDSATKVFVEKYLIEQKCKTISNIIEDTYFSKRLNISKASPDEKKSFFKALDIIKTFNDNPEKNWTDLGILLSSFPTINNFYIENEKGQKDDLVTISLSSKQFHTATLFIEGEDGDAHKEAIKTAERAASTESRSELEEVKKAWKNPSYPRTEEEKYSLLMMYGISSNSFGVCNKKGIPLDIPAALIKRYELNPHKKIKFFLDKEDVTETPFSYALICAEIKGKNLEIPAIETKFYDNIDLLATTVLGHNLSTHIIFSPFNFSKNLSSGILKKLAEQKAAAEQKAVAETTHSKAEKLEQLDLFNSANKTKQKTAENTSKKTEKLEQLDLFELANKIKQNTH